LVLYKNGRRKFIHHAVAESPGDPLPVELNNFGAKTFGNTVNISWQTAAETNNYGFELFRNSDKIGFINGSGTTTETNNYSFVDENLLPGFYRYDLMQLDFNGTKVHLGSLNVDIVIPNEYQLFQNYPNPFNPSTVIKYNIPESGFVILKVFDVLGNEVMNLVNEKKETGSYEVTFNISNLPSGIYLYQLKVNGFVETRKMMLMK